MIGDDLFHVSGPFYLYILLCLSKSFIPLENENIRTQKGKVVSARLFRPAYCPILLVYHGQADYITLH